AEHESDGRAERKSDPHARDHVEGDRDEARDSMTRDIAEQRDRSRCGDDGHGEGLAAGGLGAGGVGGDCGRLCKFCTFSAVITWPAANIASGTLRSAFFGSTKYSLTSASQRS